MTTVLCEKKLLPSEWNHCVGLAVSRATEEASGKKCMVVQLNLSKHLPQCNTMSFGKDVLANSTHVSTHSISGALLVI